MQLFLDTTDTAVLRELAATGLVDGVTTNPSLIMKSGRPMLEVIAEICQIVEGPVSAEVAAVAASAMIAEGTRLAEVAPNVVVKAPLTPDGLIATRELSQRGIAVNVTLCFSAGQALLAAKAELAQQRVVLADQRRLRFEEGAHAVPVESRLCAGLPFLDRHPDPSSSRGSTAPSWPSRPGIVQAPYRLTGA